jgi:hypothetical protein
MLIKFPAQFGAIIRLVAEHAFGRMHSADQPVRHWTIVSVATSQQDGD